MQNIKIKPLFLFENSNTKITYADGSRANIKNIESIEEITNELVIFLSADNGNNLTFKCRPINFNHQTYIAPFPNPVLIFLHTSIDNFNYSIEILKLLIDDFQLKDNNLDLYILNIDGDNMNKNYNSFIRLRMVSIITAITALEAFLNQIIPNDFKYIKKDKNGKTIKLNKNKIESTKVHFKEKLVDLISQLKENPNFENENASIIKPIMELYNIRKEIIHLKTKSQDELSLYFDSLGKMLDFDLEESIISIINYLNIVEPNYTN